MKTKHAWIGVGSLAAIAALGPLLATSGAVAPLTGLGLFALGGLGSLLAALALSVTAGIQRRKALLGPAALAWLVAAPLVLAGTNGRDVPPINDITTDLQEPPTITEEGRPILAKHDLNYPPEWVALVQQGYPDLNGQHLNEPRAEAFAAVEAAARATEGWTLHRVDAASGVIEGSEETALFHFVDDFSIRVVGDGEGSRVDMRSRSRDGRSDLGKNAERIRGFLGRLGG